MVICQMNNQMEETCENKTYVIVKNHVREIPISNENKTYAEITEGHNNLGNKKRKLQLSQSQENKKKESEESQLNSVEPNDLEELRSVYRKCKAVIKKIETKYGHLLDLNEDEYANTQKKRRNKEMVKENSSCTCTFNKKTVFDESGNEIILETANTDLHICHHKLQPREENRSIKQVNIQYTELDDSDLPEDINQLQIILKDTSIDTKYRKRVINKLIRLKQELSFEVRSNKKSLIEQLKLNSDEVLSFKGTNLSSLQGYVSEGK